MDDVTTEEELDALEALSKDMLGRAEAGEWESLAALDADRRERFAILLSAARASEVARFPQALLRLVELDRKLMEVVTSARERSASDLGKLQQSKKGKLAYRQHSG